MWSTSALVTSAIVATLVFFLINNRGTLLPPVSESVPVSESDHMAYLQQTQRRRPWSQLE